MAELVDLVDEGEALGVVGGVPASLPVLTSVGVADINATGTPSSTTYLRGDGTWSTPDGGAGGSAAADVTIADAADYFAGSTVEAALQELGAADRIIPAVTESTTSRTLVASDAGKVVECTSASAVTVTVPPNSSVAFPTGTIINIYAAGAGGVTMAAGSGVTVRNLANLTQYREVSLRKRGTDEWVQS